MASDTFRERVEQDLKTLDREQLVQFAWRCAIRALPFLGKDGNLIFWDNKNKQKYIYAVLNALDLANNTSFLSFSYTSAADADAAAADTDAYAYAADAASYASYAASYAAYYASSSHTSSTDAAVDTACAAVDAASGQLDLKSIILHDIKSICEGRGQIISTDIYGKTWCNFQNALKDEGCEYWVRLYQEIFDNNFQMDREAYDRRMNVPKEICKQGAAVVGNYLEELEKGATRLNEARIIILGDKGAGKTCIARRLVDPNAKMTTDDESTAGVNTSLWKLEKDNINVRIWDFAGHTVTHAVHQFFLSERCLYLMIYDGRTEERNRLEYWLNHMKNYGGDSKAIILVNERDRHSADIKINNLKEKYPIAGVYSFSIRDNKTKLESFRKDVIKYIKSNPSWEKQEIPTSYYQVKEKLEELFINGNKSNEYISKRVFDDIAKDCKVENTEKLLEGLHFLGVSLWYKEMDKYDTLILNPEWISHGVYKIINWINEEKRHNIFLNNFEKVFKEDADRYPIDKHEFLFNLMKHYELAFETDKEKCLIIPYLLNEDRPAELPDFHVGNSLMLRYAAEQALPPNTISRFIIRHNEEIKKARNKYIVWRYGVVLEDGKGSLALVREEDRTISVSVKGIDKTNYISFLRKTLNDIFNTYKSKKPELQYRIERDDQINDFPEYEKTLWLAESKISNHHCKDIPYYDDETGKEIPMRSTINVYNINAPNTIIGGHDNTIINDINLDDYNINFNGNINELVQKFNLLKGFEDYAKLKGYTISFTIDNSVKNEIAFKLTIKEESDKIETSSIRKELKEYIDKIKNGDDLDNMPEVFASNEHELILNSLKNQIYFQQNTIVFYESFMKTLNSTNNDIKEKPMVVVANNSPNVKIGYDIDNTTTTFKFKDCNIGLQGNLNELAQLLTEGGSNEEAKALENTAKLLEQVEECQTKEEIKKKGIGNRLKRMVDELSDEGSKLHKTVKGIRHGIGIAQDIAKTYNDIAQWAGLPQVPKPFLKK